MVSRAGRQKIDRGGHSETVGACVMEWVSLLWGEQVTVRDGRVTVDWLAVRGKTDVPTCTHPLITQLAIVVNDKVGQRHRDQLAQLLPRLLKAGAPEDPDRARTVLRRLRTWLVNRRLERLEREGHRPSELARALLDRMEEHASTLTVQRLARDLEKQRSRWNEADRLAFNAATSYCMPMNVQYTGEDLTLIRDLLRTLPPSEKPGLLDDALTALEKARAEEGLLAEEDPEEFYLTPEELDVVVRELGGDAQ